MNLFSEDTYKLYTDGGSRGNPGPAGIGIVCFKNGNKLFEKSEFIGKQTNNFAEYKALVVGLKECLRKDINTLECFLDSQLVVRQLNGTYKVNSSNIKPLYKEVKDIARRFSSISFKHVKRENNEEADLLVNQALDEHE